MPEDLTPATEAVPPEIPLFLELVAGAMRMIDLKAARYRLATGNTIKKIMDGNGRFTDFYALTVLLGMKLFSAYLLTTELWWSAEATAFLNKVKILTATFLAKIGLQIAISVHNLLSAAWEDYRLMFRGVHNAAAGLAKTISMDAGFLSNALLNIQNIVTSAGIAFGRDPAQTEVRFLITTGKFLQEWSTRWENYHRDPGKILDELQQWVLVNSYKGDFRNLEKRAKAITDAINSVNKITIDIINIEDAFNRFIVDLPSDVFTVVQEWYKPYHEEVENIRDNYVIPAVTLLLELQQQVEILSTENDVTLEQYQNALALLPDVLNGIYLNTSPGGLSNRALFESLIMKATGLTQESIKEDTENFNSRDFIRPPTMIFPPIEIPAPPTIIEGTGKLAEPPPIKGTIYDVILGDVAHDIHNTIFDDIGGD